MSITPSPRIGIIVVAGGSGTRLGAGTPKAFVGIDEHSMLRHALRGVLAAGPAQVVIVAPAGREGDALTEALAASEEAPALESGRRRDLISVVTGGETRQRSVAAGLGALWADVDVVLVHDAARSLTPPAVFERVVEAVERTGAGVVPTLPVIDTIKRVGGDVVLEAVDRADLAAAQTPQGFPRGMLVASYASAAEDYTDDTALVAAAGHPIITVPGDALSFKITTPADMDRARGLVAPVPPARARWGVAGRGPRVGVGTDVHAFAAEGDGASETRALARRAALAGRNGTFGTLGWGCGCARDRRRASLRRRARRHRHALRRGPARVRGRACGCLLDADAGAPRQCGLGRRKRLRSIPGQPTAILGTSCRGGSGAVRRSRCARLGRGDDDGRARIHRPR